MAKDKQVLVRMNDPTYEAVQSFADDYDVSKAEAMRRIAEGRLAVQGYLDKPGGLAMADGGQPLTKSEAESLFESTTDQVDSKIDQIDSKVEKVQEESDQSFHNRIVLIAVMWIGIGIAAGTPSWFPEVTYILYIGLILVYLLYTIGGESW
jgi:hypothetical protein